MKRHVLHSVFFFATLLIMVSAGVAIEHTVDEVVESETPTQKESHAVAREDLDILYVGDIMLGRAVETYMENNGTSTPFAYMSGLLSEPTVTVGNFEGVVSPIHEHAPSMTYRFSVKEGYLEELRTQGFDVLSLANNHSFDYGTSSLAHTRTLCKSYNLYCGGSPLNRDEYITHVVYEGDERIGFIFLHTLYGGVSTTTLRATLDELGNVSDTQVAYIHWGNEYELVHSSSEEELGHFLIDNGIDVVVGHHPHVVQDIEMYLGKPIVYSLGNFIFDQYFDTNVQEMIALRMTVRATSYAYEIKPLTTVSSHMQPQNMNDEQEAVLFERIFSKVKEHEGVDPLLGTITVPR